MPELETPFPTAEGLEEEDGENGQAETTELAVECLTHLPQSQRNCWLLCAARKGRLQLLKGLLETGANPNTEDDYGYTALMFLAAQGSREGLELVLGSARCIVNKRSGSMQTALHFATEKGHSDCVKMLLKAGAMVNASDDWETPLIMAVNSGSLQSVEILLAAGANVEMTDLKGFTALMHAAANGNVDILRRLLQHGACANRMLKTGALHQAAKFGHLQCLDILLEAGVSADVRDMDRFLPVELAVQTDQVPVVERLLHFMASREEAELVLNAASKHNALNSLKGLLQCGCNPQATDHRGIPAILWAVSQNNVDVTKALILHNCDINLALSKVYLYNTEFQDMCGPGEDSLTPLALAARRGFARLVKILLVAGADPSCLIKYRNAELLPLSISGCQDEQIQAYLQDGCTNPPVQPLTALCRLRIRKSMKGNLQERVPLLPLPPILQDFVLPLHIMDL